MRRLWILFATVLVLSFAVLGWIGTRIYQEAPPQIDKVVTTDGNVVVDEGQIAAGQNVWQSLGGMEVGPVWGHGSLMQTWASVEHGYWYARRGEFLQTPLMQNLRWMRIPGDTVFALGAVALAIFVAGLKTGHSFRKSE